MNNIKICPVDPDSSYIGKTKRHLEIRVKEHKNKQSAIRDHMNKCICKDNFSIDNFTIIDSGKSNFETQIKESLHIKINKPKLNNQLNSKGSSFFLSIFN